jgi:hypothetical protein
MNLDIWCHILSRLLISFWNCVFIYFLNVLMNLPWKQFPLHDLSHYKDKPLPIFSGGRYSCLVHPPSKPRKRTIEILPSGVGDFPILYSSRCLYSEKDHCCISILIYYITFWSFVFPDVLLICFLLTTTCSPHKRVLNVNI